MEQIVVITAVGQDKPGIIAALTEAVLYVGGTLDDATMTRLHGAFATMLAARLPGEAFADALRERLLPVARAHGVTVTVQAVAEGEPEAPPDTLLTVYGADRPGIVHAVASRLSARGVNITDMDTRVAGSHEAPVYVMLLEAAAGDTDLAEDLAALRAKLGVTITAQALNAEAL